MSLITLICIFMGIVIGFIILISKMLIDINSSLQQIAEPFIRRNKAKRISDSMNNMKKLGIAFSNMRELCDATDYTKTPIKQSITDEPNIISGATPIQAFGKPICIKGFHSEIITDHNGSERWTCVPDKEPSAALKGHIELSAHHAELRKIERNKNKEGFEKLGENLGKSTGKRKTVRGDDGNVIGWVDVKKTTPKKQKKLIKKSTKKVIKNTSPIRKITDPKIVR